MAEAVGTAMASRAADDSFAASVRDAIITGLIALLLFVLIIGLKTENAQDRLVLIPRFGWAVFWAVAVAIGRLLIDVFFWRGARGRTQGEGLLSPTFIISALSVAYV